MLEAHWVDTQAELEEIHPAVAGVQCSAAAPAAPPVDWVKEWMDKNEGVCALFEDGKPVLFALLEKHGYMKWLCLCVTPLEVSGDAISVFGRGIMERSAPPFGRVNNPEIREMYGRCPDVVVEGENVRWVTPDPRWADDGDYTDR